MNGPSRFFALVALTAAACHHAPPPTTTANLQCITPPAVARDTAYGNRRTDTALSAAERDALIQESRAYRAAWQARGITHYRVRIAVGCFCPWPQTPRLLEVRDGHAVALLDTLGRRAGALREPWSPYTVEGLFDAVEQTARRDDAMSVRYDACLGYPTMIRGDQRLGLPDDWFWVSATDLAPRP